MKPFYVARSSIFDAIPYDAKKIRKAIETLDGIHEVSTDNQYGWSNQPEVVTFFTGNGALAARNAVCAALGTEWIIIREKDWR